MSNERYTVTLSDAAYNLVNAFAEHSRQPRDLAADHLIGTGWLHILADTDEAKRKELAASAVKQKRTG